jgi:hypothetical protein
MVTLTQTHRAAHVGVVLESAENGRSMTVFEKLIIQGTLESQKVPLHANEYVQLLGAKICVVSPQFNFDGEIPPEQET